MNVILFPSPLPPSLSLSFCHATFSQIFVLEYDTLKGKIKSICSIVFKFGLIFQMAHNDKAKQVIFVLISSFACLRCKLPALSCLILLLQSIYRSTLRRNYVSLWCLERFLSKEKLPSVYFETQLIIEWYSNEKRVFTIRTTENGCETTNSIFCPILYWSSFFNQASSIMRFIINEVL